MPTVAQYRRFTEVLRLWQNRNRAFQHGPVVPLPSWNPALRLVASAELLDEYARQHLREALTDSDTRLAPLRDPLTLNLGAHRWLSEDREESYSDWLAWIMQGMKDAGDVLPLFGVDDQETISAFGKVERVLRETKVENGRTDIQVWFTNGFLLIEVKVQRPSPGVFQELERFAIWAAGQPTDRPTKSAHTDVFGKRMVLLGPEELLAQLGVEEPTDMLEGFEFTGWRALCMRLRQNAYRIKESDVMRAAAILIFCGAVEQNLLGVFANPPHFRAMATIDYLKAWRTGS